MELTNLTKKCMQVNQSCDWEVEREDKVALLLPSTADYRYNNKAIQMNVGISDEMENLYKTLFLKGTMKRSSSSDSLLNQKDIKPA